MSASILLHNAGKVSFVVEAGNHNNNGIKVQFDNLSKDNAYDGNLGSLTFAMKRDSRAIQLADFWAMYSRRMAIPFLESPKDSDMRDVIPPELRIAVNYIPHHIEVIFGNRANECRNRETEEGSICLTT